MATKPEKKLVFIGIDTEITLEQAQLMGDSLNKLNLPYNFLIVPESIHVLTETQAAKVIMDLVNVAIGALEKK